MKQISQDLNTGNINIYDTPIPSIKDENLLIKSNVSLISSGTEKMLLSFGKGSFIDKAQQQPEKVKEVIKKVKTEGFISTYQAVKGKLNLPLPLGYCNVGEVIDVGKNVSNFKKGDRVISNGHHAEIVSVPQNLCALIPQNVADEQAVFTVIGSIGLQGIRLSNPTFGETFLVSGMGLLGLLTSQILKAHGCIVLGLDTDNEKCKVAEKLDIECLHLKDGVDPISWCNKKTKGIGVDAAIITASTKSSSPIDIAAESCRKRGRIVLVGVTGLELKRDLFYKKELSFQVSCSYGPGRYDKNYEENSNDYPIGFVRWTEQRNFQAILKSISLGQIKTKELISNKFSINNAFEAYETLMNDQKSLGILISYPKKSLFKTKITIKENNKCLANKNVVIGFIGSGNYASSFLLPSFKKTGAILKTIVSNDGLSSTHFGNKFGFENVSTDIKDIMDDPDCNTVVICTRHDSHADLICKGLSHNKNIFVEKPICIKLKELEQINKTYSSDKIFMVGFNRRFAPLSYKLKNLISRLNTPKSYIYTCNAGYIDKDHWIHNINIGGGRLIGEACHFVDYLRFLDNSKIIKMKILFNRNSNNKDNFTLSLEFESGSIGNIHYFSNGSKSFPKERIEIFGDNKIIMMENFKKLRTWGFNINKKENNIKSDKGQERCTHEFVDAIRKGRQSPINFLEIIETQKLIFDLNFI